MQMLFRLDLFSRSSVLSLRLSFSLDRAKQVDSRVVNLVSDVAERSFHVLNCLVMPIASCLVSRELVRKFGYNAALH